MQQTRVYLDIIIAFSVYLLVISFNSIIDWKSKFNLSWKYMYCHFRQYTHLFQTMVIGPNELLFTIYTRHKNKDSCNTKKYNMETILWIKNLKKNVKILHVIQSTYQLKYLHFCLRCHILSLRGWHFSLLYKLNIGKEQIYYTFLSYSIHGYTCARSSLMIPLYLCNLHCNNTPTILSPQCHASRW